MELIGTGIMLHLIFGSIIGLLYVAVLCNRDDENKTTHAYDHEAFVILIALAIAVFWPIVIYNILKGEDNA